MPSARTRMQLRTLRVIVAIGAGLSALFNFTTVEPSVGALMQGVRPLFRRGRWEFPLLMVGVATVILLAMEWFIVSFQRGSFEVSSEFWYRSWTSALLGMLASPLLFFLIFKLAKATGFRIEMMRAPRERSY